MSATSRNTSESRSTFEAGFDMHPIQLRAALATPGQWRDALIVSVSAAGSIVVRDPFDGAETRLWNRADNTGAFAAGDPISWHPLYGVLAAGGSYVSVALIAA